MCLNVLISTVTSPELLKELKESWEMIGGYTDTIKALQAGHGYKHFTYDQGLLRRKGRCVVGPSSELRRKLLRLYHDGVLRGHSGAHTTYKKISLVFYWPKLEKDVR